MKADTTDRFRTAGEGNYCPLYFEPSEGLLIRMIKNAPKNEAIAVPKNAFE